MANLLYNKKNIIGRLFQYFQIYFLGCSVPTMESLFLIVLSMLAIESADSVRLLYTHFLSKVTGKSLNAFYYACSYAKIDNCLSYPQVNQLLIYFVLYLMTREYSFSYISVTK